MRGEQRAIGLVEGPAAPLGVLLAEGLLQLQIRLGGIDLRRARVHGPRAA